MVTHSRSWASQNGWRKGSLWPMSQLFDKRFRLDWRFLKSLVTNLRSDYTCHGQRWHYLCSTSPKWWIWGSSRFTYECRVVYSIPECLLVIALQKIPLGAKYSPKRRRNPTSGLTLAYEIRPFFRYIKKVYSFPETQSTLRDPPITYCGSPIISIIWPLKPPNPSLIFLSKSWLIFGEPILGDPWPNMSHHIDYPSAESWTNTSETSIQIKVDF